MQAIALFLVGSQPKQGGIRVREIASLLQQAVKCSLADTSAITSYHTYLAVTLQPLLLGCREIAAKTTVFSNPDQITLLVTHSTHSDISSALFATWTGILQFFEQKRRSVFSLTLAGVKWKKLGLLHFALWCNLLALLALGTSKWGHIRGYLLEEIQLLFLQDEPIDLESLQYIQKLAYFDNSRNRVFDVDDAQRGFFEVLSKVPTSIPISLDGLSIPYIRPDSIRLRYQENRGNPDISHWPYLSEDRVQDDHFGMILSAISRSRIDVSHVKQWSENGLRRRNSEVTLDQKLCLECEIQNPLNESVICEDMIVMVKENSSFIEVEKTSVSLQALESRSIQLILAPQKTGLLHLTNIAYRIHAPNACEQQFPISQPLHLQGVRLNRTLEQRQNCLYSEDPSLTLQVEPATIAISVTLEGIQEFHYFSELVPIVIHLENRGDEPLSQILLFTDNYHWFIDQHVTPHQSTDSILSYSLLPNSVSLNPGESQSVSSYLHLPESEDASFLHENKGDWEYDLRFVLLARDGSENWRMVRESLQIPLRRLVRCSGGLVETPEQTWYRCVTENLDEELELEEVVVRERFKHVL